MKPYLTINLLLIFLGSALTYYQVFLPNDQSFSQLVKHYQSRINPDSEPVKTLVVDSAAYAFWLSKTGKLHTTYGDTSNHVILNHSGEAWSDVTFIEDFCLNSANDSIYFTDIMDLESGQGAIKVSDRFGQGLKTILLLPDEIPYRLKHTDNILFYLAQQEYRDASYQLRFIDLQNGSRGTLYQSSRKISGLNIDDSLELLNISDPARGQVSFATDLGTIRGLAEARR